MKFGLLCLSLGLILGGIAGIFQTTPTAAANGWTSNELPENIYSIVIPDQTGDSINDVFVWVNYDQYTYSNPADLEWNVSCGSMILDGVTGLVVKKLKYDGEKWAFENMATFRPVYTKNNSILVAATQVQNLNKNITGTPRLDRTQFELLRISLSDLKIAARANVTGSGWENVAAMIDPNNFHGTGGLEFDPKFYYMGFNTDLVPNSTYNKDYILYYNSVKLKNEAGTEYNDTRRLYRFIDPFTLTEISSVEMSHDTGFNDVIPTGPMMDYQSGWCYPYHVSVHFNTFGQTAPAVGEVDIYMAAFSKYQNFSQPSEWIIFNKSIGLHETYQNSPFSPTVKAVICLNQSLRPTSVVILESNYHDDNQSISQADRDKLDAQYFEAYRRSSLNIPQVTRVAIISCETGDGHINFKYEAFDGAQKGTLFGVSNNETSNWGLAYNIVPVANYTQLGIQNTSIAIEFMSNRYELQYVKKNAYPTTQMSFAYLNASAVSDVSEFYTLNNATDAKSVRNVTCVHMMFYVTKTFNTINFDVDNDNFTDLIIPGALFNKTLLESLSATNLNGPYFVIASSIHGALQHAYYSFTSIENLRTRTDANNDTVSDALFNSRSTLFTKKVYEPEPSFIESHMGYATTKIFFILGVIMIISGIVLLLFPLKMRDAKIQFKSRDKKVLLLFILIALGLIGALYTILGNIVSSTQNNTGTQIGQTPQYVALTRMLQISGWATFAFLTVVPGTIGLYLLLTPGIADGIVALNQISFARKIGLTAARKKEEMKDLDKLDIVYKITLMPPFFKKLTTGEKINRVVSILMLSVSVGLLIFNYLSPIVYPDLASFASFSDITDANFSYYINALFLLIIIPGIVAVPVFFWLIPTSWLLEDMGVLFYVKDKDLRKPEDVESVSGWFSEYLKGFLGISAIFSYIQFVYYSPITRSYANFGVFSNTIFLFVFGFIIFAGLALGFLVVAFYELMLPFNAQRLIAKLKARKIDVVEKKIAFVDIGEITDERIMDGFTKESAQAQSVTPKDSSPKEPPTEPKAEFTKDLPTAPKEPDKP